MKFIADFHIHSKYSRATSPEMNVEALSRWAGIKGVQVLGSGDFTHHLWLEELKAKLEPQKNNLYVYDNINFILTAEISSIYSKYGRTRKVHSLIFAPTFKVVDEINKRLSRIGNLAADGRPILGLDAAELARIVFNICDECMVIPAHAWTPHFSVFGSNSGFNSLEECYEEVTPRIRCIETGLSSDPAMNWRLSALDNITLISNSDAHSPNRIGREANVFDADLGYNNICDILRQKDKQRFLYTMEFFPEEGKYHYDGHRNCRVCLSPAESKKNKNICPKCRRPLTIGVMNRVDTLADRAEGYKPDQAIPYKNLIPLDEIIAAAIDVSRTSKAVGREYQALIRRFGTEFNILLDVSRKELEEVVSPRIAEGITRMREGRVEIHPGYDGEYGRISIFGKDELAVEKQYTLF